MTRRLLIALLLVPFLLGAAATPRAQIDPCVSCGTLFASAGPGDLWLVDLDAGTSTFVGTSFPNFTDIGITTDGRLFGMSFEGDLYLIDACTAGAMAFDTGYYGSGLAGDPATPDDLLVAGPPLGRIDAATGNVVFIGGNTLGPPPLWCGPMSGDLDVEPTTGVIYGTLQCLCPGGDTLVTIDPATGDVLAEIGCIVDELGNPQQVFGLAFDDQCRLVGSPLFGPFLLLIDPATAQATTVPIAGGFDGAFGLALTHCPDAPCLGGGGEEASCEPRTQGFWKRQCMKPHPAGEHENLGGYAGCASTLATFAGRDTAEEACATLHEDPRSDKCLQAETQLMVAMLNVCSGRLDPSCCVRGEAAGTVGEAIDFADGLLSNPARTREDCVAAWRVLNGINTGSGLCR